MSPRRNLRARSVAVAALLLVGRASAFLPQTPIRYPYVSVHGCLVLRDGASLSSRSRTRRYMVADIADSVAEKASTETLMDLILDESLRSSARKPIIMEYDPSSKAIWKHWKGTIFAETWRSAAKHIIWAATVYLVFQRYPKTKLFLKDFYGLWGQVLTVTTFTLSFFVNESYTLWRTCLNISRTLQGRLNDLMMGLSTHAIRIDPETAEGSSTFSPGSRKLLLVVARYVRLFHIFCYGSFTRSHRPLLTPLGMRRMVERGLMTAKERTVLIQAPVAATQRFNVVLMWIFRAVIEGRKANLFVGGPGFEQQTMGKIQEIRVQANSMESVLRGRMPFAYVHVVQVLIDAVLWMYPVAVFTEGVSLQIGLLGTGLLTICYQGLFDLSKRFLDPYHNENFWSGDDALIVDTLIAESNAGSLRWVYGLDEMPIPYQSFQNANFNAYVLPDEGYTKKEAKERLENKQKKEAQELQSSEVETTQEEYQLKAAELLEAAKEEYEETQLILNAPPGSDFVPGLDDDNENHAESLADVYSTKDTPEVIGENTPVDVQVEGMEMFDRFVDAAQDEYRETNLAVGESVDEESFR